MATPVGSPSLRPSAGRALPAPSRRALAGCRRPAPAPTRRRWAVGPSASADNGSEKPPVDAPRPTASRGPAVMAMDAGLPVTADGARKDWPAVLKYIGATAAQFLLIRLALRGLQIGTEMTSGVYPTVIVSLFFAFTALKSRVFSPLDNSRPTVANEKKGKADGKRPSWMPPPLAFPIIWTTIAVLRAVAAVLMWEACGRNLLAAPLGWYILHLCIGDTWNTINNVERRRGTAAVVVLFVLASVYNATFQYAQVNTTAALVLAPSCLWLTIATVLVWTIWSMNGKDPLFPTK